LLRTKIMLTLSLILGITIASWPAPLTMDRVRKPRPVAISRINFVTRLVSVTAGE
jgi:hypothetical protein